MDACGVKHDLRCVLHASVGKEGGEAVNRPTKYRAWNKTLEKMQEAIDISLDPEFGGVWVWGKAYYDADTGEHEADKDFWTWDDIELLEFTGRYDAKGKEVYESDILGIDDPKDASRAVIVFKDAAFKAQIVRYPRLYDEHWFESDAGWVVIGNMHEHPELLQESQP